MTRTPLLDGLVRARFLVMALLAVAMYTGGITQLEGYNDWRYFTLGSDVLFGEPVTDARDVEEYDPDGTGGLHLYAEQPFIQIGPPGVILARILQLGPRDGLYVAAALVQALGLLTVWLVDRTMRGGGRWVPLSMLLGGSFVTIMWGSLTYFTHLDDAITIAALAAALLALRERRWVAAGALLGLAAASKPWGVVVILLVLAPPSWQARLRSAAAATLVIAAFWGPFVLADPGTFTVSEFHLQATPRAPLAAIGLGTAVDGSWMRPVQFAASIAMTAFVLARRQWLLVPLAGFATRLLLDPLAYQYYVAGVAVAALIADVGVLRWRVPALTSVVLAAWCGVQMTDNSKLVGQLRASSYLLLLVAAVALAARAPTRDRDEPQPLVLSQT